MRATWHPRIQKSLANEDPSILVRLLDLAGLKDGISQCHLKSALRLNQPRLSKLMIKLRKLKWVEERKLATDRRASLTTTTAKAVTFMATLELELTGKLSEVLQGASVRKRRMKV